MELSYCFESAYGLLLLSWVYVSSFYLFTTDGIFVANLIAENVACERYIPLLFSFMISEIRCISHG